MKLIKEKSKLISKKIKKFPKSCSLFTELEFSALKIVFVPTNDVNDIFTKDHREIEINPYFKQLLLPGYTKWKICLYQPSKKDGFNKHQRRFLLRLKSIIQNNIPDYTTPRYETSINRLIDFFCCSTLFDDGLNKLSYTNKLDLKIGKKKFGTSIIREGRKGNSIVWLLHQEMSTSIIKQRDDDFQLVYAMIAAVQQNYNRLGKLYPNKILGIRILAHNITFYSISPKLDYFDGLSKGLPNKYCKVYKLGRLSLYNPGERRLILHYLSVLCAEIN